MNVLQLNNMFSELKSKKGSIAKKNLIKKFSSDEDFLKICKFLFDTRITTGIAKKKMKKVLLVEGVATTVRHFENLEDILKFVSENNTGTDSVVRAVQVFISQQPKETHEFLECLFIKDYPCGVSAKTINEALDYDFIKIHEVLLGHKYSEKGDTVKGDFYLTLKMDDNRATFCPDPETGEFVFLSRQNQVFEGLNDLMEEIKKLPSGFIYDGGLISDDESLAAKDRFRKTGSILRKKGIKTGLWFVIYDAVPIEEWTTDKFTKPYSYRREFIEMAVHNSKSDLIKCVELLYKGDDKSVIFTLLKQVISDGHEGLMLNTAEGKYEKKRSIDLLKIKEFYTADLRVIGYKEHKHGNKLGAFIVDYKGNPTNVGFGFSDEERIKFWRDREDYIGKIIEVKYFQESENKDGVASIRHGGFERLRLDKDEVSYS